MTAFVEIAGRNQRCEEVVLIIIVGNLAGNSRYNSR